MLLVRIKSELTGQVKMANTYQKPSRLPHSLPKNSFNNSCIELSWVFLTQTTQNLHFTRYFWSMTKSIQHFSQNRSSFLVESGKISHFCRWLSPVEGRSAGSFSRGLCWNHAAYTDKKIQENSCVYFVNLPNLSKQLKATYCVSGLKASRLVSFVLKTDP